MLTRNGIHDGQIIGDAFKLPFADNSVDYITVNGVLHHFGRKRGDDRDAKLIAFIKEAMRVASKGLICLELAVPRYAEFAESVVLRVMGDMPTFVFSTHSLLKIVEKSGFKPEQVISKRIGQMLPPLTVVPPILDYEWLKIPIVLLPYYMLYFVIRK